MRIKSTANIAKITKAMQMVAAAKLRGAETRLKSARPLMNMVEEMTSFIEAPSDKKTTFVPVTTDRGLCGGVNVQISKGMAQELLPAAEAAGASVEIVVVGDKGSSQIRRVAPDKFSTSVSGVFAQVIPHFGQASCIAEQVLETDADKYTIFYNKFKSAVSQIPTSLDIPSARAMQEMDVDPLNDFEIESCREDLVNNFAEFNLATGILTAMVENQCSEVASKMAAMDNATRNCDSMVEKLQVQYNKARQAKITTELIEIISGAESLKG